MNSDAISVPLLPSFAVADLATALEAFCAAPVLPLRQFWLAAPEPQFGRGTVRLGWRSNSLCLLAELTDTDIYSTSVENNQRLWELGDVFEIFLRPKHLESSVEFHINPNGHTLQLRFPNLVAVARARRTSDLSELILPGKLFSFNIWRQPRENLWAIYAEIPGTSVGEMETKLGGCGWLGSFSRYDYTRGRVAPVISSTSPLTQPDFHRQVEWNQLLFQE